MSQIDFDEANRVAFEAQRAVAKKRTEEKRQHNKELEHGAKKALEGLLPQCLKKIEEAASKGESSFVFLDSDPVMVRAYRMVVRILEGEPHYLTVEESKQRLDNGVRYLLVVSW